MTKFPKVVFSDFDGTLTEQGKFSPAFFDVLDIIKKNNSELVIVTGRPLSWAHFLLTHFDLNCVVTEGGGMLSIKKDEGESFKDIALIDQVNIQNLEKVSDELIEAFEGLILSEDSSCRTTDRAIDLGVMAKVKKDEEIENFFNDRHINFSRSNVHLNFWSGDISKKSSIEHYMKLKNINQSECVFIGDSLNDESAFDFMENSVGVANICEVEDKLEHFPNIILRGKDKEEIYGVMYFLNSLL